jgi:hypothetical protein
LQQSKTQDNTKPIHYVNSNAGAGKSYLAQNKINSGYFPGVVVIALPTEVLLNSWAANLTEEYYIISSDFGEVVPQLKSALSPDFHIKVILCTHAALELFCIDALDSKPMQDLLKGKTVIIDEKISSTIHQVLRVDCAEAAKDNFPLLNWLTPSPDNPSISFLNEEFRTNLQRYYNEKHASSDYMHKILWCILHGAPMFTEEIKRDGKLVAYNFSSKLTSPVAYLSEWAENFLILGASVHKTELIHRASRELNIPIHRAAYEHWPDESRNRHRKTSRINIHYALVKGASLKRLWRVYTDLLYKLRSVVGERFIYVTNKDKRQRGENPEMPFATMFAGYFPQAEKLPGNPIGLNYYAGYNVHKMTEETLRMNGVIDAEQAIAGHTKAVYLTVANLSPEYVRSNRALDAAIGLDPDELKEIRFHEMNSEPAYQMLARSKLRDPDYTGELDFVVASEDTANYLKENYFPDANVTPLGIYEPETERQKIKVDDKKITIATMMLQGMTQAQIIKDTGYGRSTVKRKMKEITQDLVSI